MIRTIKEFRGRYRFLSNFYPSPVYWEGRIYPTVEHAYQATKSGNNANRFAIRHAKSPGEARRLGQSVKMQKGFDLVKVRIMELLITEKFMTHSELASDLLGTSDLLLEEGNTWGDKFWGVCGGEGENHLGKILMTTRTNLRRDRDGVL